MKGERGETLAEVAVAVAIFAIATGALLAGTVAAAHRFGPDAVNDALHNALTREMRIALDVVKYQGGIIVPASVATTVPMPGASPAPVQMSIATSTLPGGVTQITLTAALIANPGETATLIATAPAPAPLPQSTILVNGDAPQ